MRCDSISRIESKTMKITVDKDNIGNFIILNNRRDLRKATVNKLVNLLESGNHFETPIMANITSDGKMRLLDGNHRIEAVTKYLENHPDRKVQLWVFYYEGLNEEEERAEYTKWNLGQRQSTNDFIKQYWNTFPMVKWMKQDFPCKVSHAWIGGTSIELKQLVYSILYKDNTFPPIESTAKTIDRLQNMGIEDFKLIREFMKDYIAVFGNVDKSNMHYKKAFFSSVQRIWIDNLSNFSRAEMIKNLSKLRNHERAVFYSTQGATKEVLEQCRLDLLRVLNSHKSRNLFGMGKTSQTNTVQTKLSKEILGEAA